METLKLRHAALIKALKTLKESIDQTILNIKKYSLNRNLTFHMYKELLAGELKENIPDYYQALSTITNRLGAL